MRKYTSLIVAFVWCLSNDLSLVLAHEGHGHGVAGQGNTAKHYLTEPVHLAQLFGLVAIAATLVWLGYRWMSSRNPSDNLVS